MHRRFSPLFLAVSVAVLGTSAGLAAAQAADHSITARQAHQIAVLVAHHDEIDLNDTHVELNSMDLGRDFAPGFYSFILIRESTSPGPDETLRRYAISRRTGDVWEMNLCTHYDFPELTHLQRSLSGRSAANAAELSGQSKRLGCTRQESRPTS